MANSVSASFRDVFAKDYQTTFYKENVAKKIVEMSFKSDVYRARKYKRTYAPTDYGQSNLQRYSRGSSITITDMTDTSEELVINSEFADGKYIDNFDQMQTNLEFAAKYGENMATSCSNQLDADILGEWVNAASVVDDGSLGGTSGNGITLTTSNVLKVVGEAKKKLKKQNVPTSELFGVISPEFEQVLLEYGAGRDTAKGDSLNEEGRLMNFYGFDLYVSNQLGTSAVLLISTNVTAGDTITINGVVFTVVSSIGTTAGNVLAGADQDATLTNLAALINTPGTTTATGVALSAADQRKLINCSATANLVANTLTVNYKGLGVLTVSETLTAAPDIWTTTLQKQHCLFGKKKSIWAVVQQEPTIQPKDVPDKLGKNLLVGTLYGYKSFTDTKPQLVDVAINSSAY